MAQGLTCCFTGHRPEKLGFQRGGAAETALKNRITGAVLRLIQERGVRHFISGMALGVDTYAAQSVLKLKELFPEITLECAVPCRGQESRWSKEDKAVYTDILSRADTVTVLQDRYTPFCMQLRDAYMVDRADLVLAVWDGTPTGGTAYTVKCAEKRKKEIIVIPMEEKEKGESEKLKVKS